MFLSVEFRNITFILLKNAKTFIIGMKPMKRGNMKVVLYIIITVVFLLLISIFLLKFMMRMNTKILSPNEIILGDNTQEKSALIIYQPTVHNSGRDITFVIGNKLVEMGYQVTVNYPSPAISYDLNKYDIIVLGSGVYGSNTSAALKRYMSNINFHGRNTMIYVVGKDLKFLELNILEDYALESNCLRSVKVHPKEFEKIAVFVEHFVEEYSRIQ